MGPQPSKLWVVSQGSGFRRQSAVNTFRHPSAKAHRAFPLSAPWVSLLAHPGFPSYSRLVWSAQGSVCEPYLARRRCLELPAIVYAGSGAVFMILHI